LSRGFSVRINPNEITGNIMGKHTPAKVQRTAHAVSTTTLAFALSIGISGCAKETPPVAADASARTETFQGTQTTALRSPTTTTAEDPASTVSPGAVTQTTLPKPDEFQLLVTTLETGGLCAGPCGNVQTNIYSDGSWTYRLALDPNVTVTTLPPIQGKLDMALIAELRAALTKTTAADLQALPVTKDYCPSAADGRDLSYTYRLQGTEVTVSNCTVDLTEADELLRLTSVAWENVTTMANEKS
jgi:hypothetical protein